MITNIVLGMLLPLGVCAWIFKKSPKLVTLMFPLGTAIAFVANDWGFNIFWVVEPTHDNPSLPAYPYGLGYFPLLSSAYAYAAVTFKIRPSILIILFAIPTTLIEHIAEQLDKVHYLNGWNSLFTLLIYLSGFIVSHLYLKLLFYYKLL
ncbi:hypothetical protein [Salibacterium aidingense]|uniref:hypothetical protein n=1 Tax=Salibacterium aidingense TaxID=384933 RepID=UPI003BDE01DB